MQTALARPVLGHLPAPAAPAGRLAPAQPLGSAHCRAQASPGPAGAGVRQAACTVAAAGANGAGGRPAQLAAESGLGELREEISELRQLLAAQGSLVQQQMETIDRLKQQLAGDRAAPEPPPAALFTGPAADAGGSPAWSAAVNPFEAQRAAVGDRRFLGMYDARFHSTTWGATPKDFRVLPKRIILVRHAQSEGNVDSYAYTYVPDPQVPLTEKGHRQARDAGERIRAAVEADGAGARLYFYTSPYKRSQQTFEALAQAFGRDQIQGCQEEVQLREQDFGNFQDLEGKAREKAERLRFGRFFYRFPNGESGADVYDRMTIFEDHLIRDINAGRFARDASLVLVTHGLALRVFLMRWFHWSVDQMLDVYNPPNAEPLVMERVDSMAADAAAGGQPAWIHTKALYRLTEQSRDLIKGCTSEMCVTSCLPTQSPAEATSSQIWDARGSRREFPPWEAVRPT